MPVLSVIVPTHNRAIYARSCIEAVLSFPDSDLELVVSDTSTDGLLVQWLNGDGARWRADPRMRYVKIDTPSNLTLNHNDAMAMATGEYACIIGDDDAITSAAIAAARWAADHDVAAVSQTVTATYAWPDFRSRLARGGHAARLYLPTGPGNMVWRSASADLDAALARAFQSTDSMPRCYHGVVRRSLLEDVKARTGAYFHGSSPDMSGAVAMACLIDQYVETTLPLTIPGVSGGSNSGRSAMNTHKGELSAETQTSGFEQAGWTAGVPRFFAVETVWAHAGLATLQHLRPDLIGVFNFIELLALCGARHPEYMPAVTAAQAEVEQRMGVPLGDRLAAAIRREKWRRLAYVARRAMWPTAANGRHYVGNVTTVAEASRRYEAEAHRSGLTFPSAALPAFGPSI